jgi:lipid II:glycine glycyltransferase (peptidoglycan interpeptide bridge formation enzyme)
VTLAVVRQLDFGQWSDFVRRHPHGNVFQSPQMFQVWQATRHNDPFLLAAVDGEGRIRGVLQGVVQKEYSAIMGTLTARAIVWGGPLVEDDDEEVFDLLMSEYSEFAGKRAIYSQFRNLWSLENVKQRLERLGFIYEEHLNIHVDLNKSEEQLWKEVHSKRRNEIRRARKEGTVVEELTQKNQILEAYSILMDVYRRARLPIHHSSLFETAFDVMGPEGMVRFFGAYFEGELIGTIVVFCYNGTVYDWYAGSRRDFYHKYPNDLLPWHVFLWAREAGFTLFDFGGAGKPGKPYGVRDYKKKFGGELRNFGRFEKVHKPLLMRIGKLGFTLWKSLKRT